MPKFFWLASWTLLVAAAAFTAGRLTLEKPATPALAESVAVEKPRPFAPPTLAQPPVVISNPQLPQHTPAKSSYAADYQQLQLLMALAATNPALAMEKSRQFKGAIKLKAQADILDIWGAIDPNRAWTWVQSNQPDNSGQFIKLLESIGRKEPRTAVTYAETLAEAHRELRKDIYSSLITGLTQNGAYLMATDLVGRLVLEPETKTEFVNFIVGAWASYEPQSALQWVMTQPEDIKAANLQRLGESWADVDPQGAVDFAASQSGTIRETLLLPAFKKWLDVDAGAASTWLTAAQSHKDFDGVIAELASQPAATNSEVKAALALAGRVHDSELRLNTLTSILSAFKQKDPNAAAAYLQDIHYISDAERARLREDLAF